MLSETSTDELLVGSKQTLKAIAGNQVKKIFLAKDIDQPLKKEILEAVNNNNIPFEIVESKNELGRICGIDVSAASAALLK
ncbi:large subunit ribosomal protein L7A [Halanaerobium saccharolyticum]|jgi:large subunit ribosomal protein L7A|uniref:Large subunit ribosomal protein L7A n=1 Tax=Halanaerobium saccharolyticum TaxID=43595 RepID=A0A2T5RM84_9FIRM|nr:MULTISPECIES: ribosomal L7Ae/L30e/S12e/Gadd45 family protein [Halanaerobium]PTW00472.1 large subunit ribosomal protein L7A [Halanaerobium saccharolyticum]PUU91247.1 MAG: large subunit ribosomal protein L7A [Halanaerobium sp.]PUU93689.1 MAG: large subunit ribosomal protein L7A [Halanaerobium sp.]TDQ05996.1 large subunit ribosomal protein L7A [Halanaerobium saccharolyticum]